MILCEIGNTHYHFMADGKIWKKRVNEKLDLDPDSTIYVISVNESAYKKLASNYNTINLEPFISLDTAYRGLGVDRAVACMAVEDGVVIDAGTAITVDIMQHGIHLGGFIYPGLNRFQQMYAQISPVLEKAISFSVDLNHLPQSTAEAISYGVIRPLIDTIKIISKNKRTIFTGGDGGYFARFFDDAIVDHTLIFKGMEKIINELKGEI